jgi:hypothetical protein
MSRFASWSILEDYCTASSFNLQWPRFDHPRRAPYTVRLGYTLA